MQLMRHPKSILAGFAALTIFGCQTGRRPSPVFTPPAEAISLSGDTLRQPALEPATRARLEADLAAARSALATRPDDPDALIWVGRRLGYLGRFREAIATFSEGVRRFPGDARFLRHRGHRYISVREFENAVADFDRAVGLTRGKPDSVEPDGQPNERNIPIGSLQSNIWYHLALAHYLRGDWDRAARAAREGIKVSSNPDRLVSQTHWLYMALRRAGRDAEAAHALIPIRNDFDVIENASYYELVKMYKRAAAARATADSALASVRTPSDASLAYGYANWYLYNGDTTAAVRAFERIIAGGSWSSFGYIAAEADLARIRRAR